MLVNVNISVPTGIYCKQCCFKQITDQVIKDGDRQYKIIICKIHGVEIKNGKHGIYKCNSCLQSKVIPTHDETLIVI